MTTGLHVIMLGSRKRNHMAGLKICQLDSASVTNSVTIRHPIEFEIWTASPLIMDHLWITFEAFYMNSVVCNSILAE